MRKFVLPGIGIFLLLVAVVSVVMVTIKNDSDYSLHTLNREVKVVNYISGGEGHIDIRVDGTGALIIKQLSAKTATVHAVGTTDVMVVIKETNAQVSFNAEGAVRPHFSLSSNSSVNTQMLESFIQGQYERTYEEEYSIPKAENAVVAHMLKGNVHTIEHLEFCDNYLGVIGTGALIIKKVTNKTGEKPTIRVEGDNILVSVLETGIDEINIDTAGSKNSAILINSPEATKDALRNHLCWQYPGYHEGREALQ